jgi:ribosome-binding protein aMBF1 (putative translation factor)
MKLGDVLRKERTRKKMSDEDVASRLGLSLDAYRELENGSSPIEEWGPKLAQLAIKLTTPTSRLISDTGKSVQANQIHGQCGRLVTRHREKRELSREDLARQLDWTTEELTVVEDGKSPLEQYGPLLLHYAEVIDQPIFNLFYPCGLPFAELGDYP